VHVVLHADDVKQHAAELGFDACGIACAAPIDPEDRLGKWLAAGNHADMTWMERTREIRQDVAQKLPGTRSVIVVARNYYVNADGGDPKPPRISRYAWGRDYHRVLEKPLRALAKFVESANSAHQTYCCIDSGPVMEKAWAARAGLGWIGKNSLVLRRGMGSYFFLGAILTTAQLEPDAPVSDQCGSCRICIDACPTAAIVEARVVDARKCISYQTIENRGDIPQALHRDTGAWLFGCDVCQDVCPWNRRVPETSEPDFTPRYHQLHPDAGELESISDEEFLKRFAGTPVMRAKASGIRRNARIVLDNLSAVKCD